MKKLLFLTLTLLCLAACGSDEDKGESEPDRLIKQQDVEYEAICKDIHGLWIEKEMYYKGEWITPALGIESWEFTANNTYKKMHNGDVLEQGTYRLHNLNHDVSPIATLAEMKSTAGTQTYDIGLEFKTYNGKQYLLIRDMIKVGNTLYLNTAISHSRYERQ